MNKPSSIFSFADFSIAGFDIVMSTVMTNPRLYFNWPEYSPVIAEFNEWLYEQFGDKNGAYIARAGTTLYCNKAAYNALSKYAKTHLTLHSLS